MRALRPGIALLPLRLFLGGTFVYAGIQKLTDPGFFKAGAPTYIGTQLHDFAAGTPGGFLLRTFAIPHPTLAGVGVAIFEIAVGLLMLGGLKTRIAAAAGLSLNLVFFLTASWHTSPYFLGSDIVFVFAWLPFVLAGAAEQPALDNLLENPPESLLRRTRLSPPVAGQPVTEGEIATTRRVVLAEFVGAALAIAGISTALRGSYNGPLQKTAALGGSGASGASGGGATGGGGSSLLAGLPKGAVKLGSGSQLPRGQAATYSDPSDGSPDILIREKSGQLKAFSAVCTHAGCTVAYDGRQIYCPCHGGVYNPDTGAVEGGPPPTGLTPKTVVERKGQIYAVPS